MSIYVSLEDLVIAYRKAKVDTFYETGHLTAQAFAEYEHNLFNNLTALRDKINSTDLHWFGETEFIGGYYCTLKSLKINVQSKHTDLLFYSSSKLNWNSIKNTGPDFRLIGNHSVNFHVLSSLWIEKVGLYLEKGVSDNSYGCRLRYNKIAEENEYSDSSYIKSSFNHFRSYLTDYQQWQFKGIEKIRKAIEEKRKVVAITADFKKYYHRIDASFINDPDFLNTVKFNGYSELQRHLNQILLHAISSWSIFLYNDTHIPRDFKYNGHCGVPMGLGAAKIIANLLLTYLDRKIENELKPIYYGRYVDDIFLVLEDGNNLKNPDDFWRFVKKRIVEIKSSPRQLKKNIKNGLQEYSPKGIVLNIPYAKKSLIEFGNEKQKFFFLEGISGESFLDTLKENLEENSSEWNLPPNTDNDLESFSKEMANASSDHQESANGLRKSDGLSIRRLKLILFLKRFETCVFLLPRAKWENTVKKFFDLVIEYTITPENIATYSKYYARIVGLAVKTGNWDCIKRITEAIKDAYKNLKDKSVRADEKDSLKRNQLLNCLNSAEKYQMALLAEGIFKSYDPFTRSAQNAESLNEIIADMTGSFSSVQKITRDLFFADLHSRSFKEAYLYPVDNLNIEGNELNLYYDLLLSADQLPNYNTYRQVSRMLWKSAFPDKKSTFYPFAFYFYTRPFTLLELSILFPSWHRNENFFRNACKLFHIDWQGLGSPTAETDNLKSLKPKVLDAPKKDLNRVFAFTSLETKIESWLSVVREDAADPDIEREQRILDLAGDIIRCKKKEIDYVLFPELSIPRKLLLYLSSLLLKKKISIIAGVEYKITRTVAELLPPNGNCFVSNQLFYILCVPGRYFPQHITIIQEKIIPAQEEERDLFEVGGKYLRAEDEFKYLINHGGFWFSGLICNDFLNIDNRAILRGLVDALIIIEWNKDINTYDALVEASANDLHTFILQVNNRTYGDTRLRGPYKEAYERDKVRVRGGELDYFVVATLQVKELREFQKNHRSPSKPFKPIPTGFKMSEERRKFD